MEAREERLCPTTYLKQFGRRNVIIISVVMGALFYNFEGRFLTSISKLLAFHNIPVRFTLTYLSILSILFRQ